MTLLFDENLSPSLVRLLTSDFRQLGHVRDVGLRGATDELIWNHARQNNLTIVSKDTDFRDRSYLHGFPPKVIWLDVGNAGTAAIAQLLRHERQRVDRFEPDLETSLLILSLEPSKAV